MGINHRIGILFAGLLSLALAQSCSKDVTGQDSVYPEVLVLFSPDGLGDLAYNDEVLRGIELFMNEDDINFYLSFMSPTDHEIAEFLIRQWWDERDATYTDGGPVPRKLLVLADGGYADIARAIVDPALISKDLSVIAFETGPTADASDPLITFELSMYGASWLAGRTARELGCRQPLVILGDGSNTLTFKGRDGFTDGFQGDVPAEAMASDWQGYCMPMDAYRMMYDYDGRFDFIYPIAGGTNMGIYRYLRENPGCGIYTSGMDVDQSPYSTLITGSLVKHIDLVVCDYLKKWYDKADMPHHQVFGLESGYVDWVIPERYSYLDAAVGPLRQEAIEKEKAYGKGGK